MPFLTMLLVYVATFLITELLRPKPNLENAKPASLGDFQVPTATEGRPIPIIFGRVNMKGPNVIWYGDLRTKKIEQEVSTGMFSSEDVTIGFEYYLGVQLALCRGPLDGPLDQLINVRNDDSFVWGPKGPNAEAAITPSPTGTAFSIDVKNHFGERKDPGQGGLLLPCEFYDGSQTQSVDAYLAGFQTPLPAYRGTSYIVIKQGWIGNSPNLRAFEFEMGRIPDGLNLAGVQPGDEIINDGANPMNVIYEILTNPEWGLNLGAIQIDVAGLRAVAATLATEGNGFAFIWDRVQEVAAMIRMIEEQVDGVLIQETITGIFNFTLIRDDYTPGTLPLLDESNVIELQSFRRPSWNSTANVVSIQFSDSRKSFKTSYAVAQDSANIDIVQNVSLSNVNFPGVNNAALANSLAWRELRLLSYPIATGRLIVNRTQFDLKPGDVRELTWARLGLVRLPIRITKINRGNLLKGQIAIDFAEDIFAASAGTFADPPDTGWTPPSTTALPALFERLFELPFVLTDLALTGANTVGIQVGTLVVRSGTQEIGYNRFVEVADFPTVPSDPVEGSVITPASTNGTTPFGLLVGALDRGETNGFQDAVGFIVDNGVDLDALFDIDSAALEALTNGCLIDDEIILFSDITEISPTSFTIFNLVRGALDTLPDDHADNAQVWFFTYGTGLANAAPEGDLSLNWKVRNQLFTTFDTFLFASTIVQSLTTDGRAGRAYPPRDIEVNPAAPGGGFFPVDAGSPSGAQLVGLLGLTWAGSDKFTQARATAWDDPHVTQEAGTAFRVRVIEDPGGADTVVLDISGIPAGATGGAYNASGYADDTVTDLYQAELSSVSANGESQVWTIGPFNIYGFGYKMDEKFGGDNDGILLAKGDPPAVVDPIPGVTSQSVFRITVSGIFDTRDDLFVRIAFLELGQTVSQNENYFIDGSAQASIQDYLSDIAANIAADFDSVKIQAVVDGDVLTISTSFGSLGGSVQNNTATTTFGVIQEFASSQQGDQQILHLDLWEGDPATSPSTDVLAPQTLISYNADAPRANRFDLQVRGITDETKKQLPAGGLFVKGIEWGGRLVAPGTQAVSRDLPLRDGEPNFPTAPFDSSLLSVLRQLQANTLNDYIAAVNWGRYDPIPGGGQFPDRPGVEIRMRPNFEIVMVDSYATAPVNTYFVGLFGPIKLLATQVTAATPDTRLINGLKHAITVAYVSENEPSSTNFQPVVADQIYTVHLDATTLTENATAGDATDSPYRDDIYSRMKVQVDATGLWIATLNTAPRFVGGPTYVTSMDIERVTFGGGFAFDATAGFGLILQIENFEQ
jgi:hypothetical protein